MSVMMSWFRLSHLSSLLLFSLLSKLYTFVIKSHHVTDDAQLHDDNDEIMNSEACLCLKSCRTHFLLISMREKVPSLHFVTYSVK